MAAGEWAVERDVVREGIWALAHAVNDAYPSLYVAVLPLLIARLHFTVAAASLLGGLIALTTQLPQPLWGWWSDRAGGPWFMVGGLLAGGVFTALGLAWAPSYLWLAVFLMLGGAGNAAFHPHMAATVSRTGRRAGRRMSTWMASGMVGHALAPLAVTAAVAWWGRAGLWRLALPGLLAAALLYSTVAAVSRPPEPAPAEGLKGFGRLLAHAVPFLIPVALRNLGSVSAMTLLPVLWHHRHYPLAVIGLLLSLIFLVGLFGNLLGGALSDRWGPKPVLMGSVAAAALALAAFWVVTGPGVYVLAGVYGFAANGAGAVLLVYGQRLLPRSAGMASGLTLGVGNAVGALGATVTGAAAEAFGLGWALLLAAVLSLSSLPFLARLAAEPRAFGPARPRGEPGR